MKKRVRKLVLLISIAAVGALVASTTAYAEKRYRDRSLTRGYGPGADLYQLAYELEYSAGELYYMLDRADDRRAYRYRDRYGRQYGSSKYLRKARSDARSFARRAEKFRKRLNRDYSDPYRVQKEFSKLHRDFYKLERWEPYLDGNRALRRSMNRVESILYQMDRGRTVSTRDRYRRDPYRDGYRARRRRGR